ncbi:MAG: glycosyltransferase [Alphaproteobacteria bacterium]
MRILFVTGTGYIPEAVSGANVSLHALCMRLAGLGHEPIVACTPAGRALPGWPAPGYDVIRVADPVAAMAEMIPVLEPDATVVRAPWPAVRAAQWAAAAPARRLHVYFNSLSFEHAFPAPARAPGLSYAANSRFLAGVCEALLGCRVALVPSVIEPDDYRCTPDGDRILFVNPSPSKGAGLVAAIAECLPHRRFLVARSWADAPADPLLEIALPNVETAAPKHDMRAIYRQARLLLMPSLLEESTGRVVSEAQFSGIPAVAIDRGGLAENVGAGGTVLPLGAPPERWCGAIEALLGDDTAYAAASRAARAHAARPECTPDGALARFLAFVTR